MYVSMVPGRGGFGQAVAPQADGLQDVTSYSDVQDYLPYRVPEVWLFRDKALMGQVIVRAP
jgi:hypothetical protein